MKQFRFSAVLFGLALVLALSGCTISTHESKGESGKKNEDVDIRTPVGSLTVHSGDVDAKDTGLSVYPGARVMPGHKDNDSSANVNINTSFFGVKVVAVKFTSDDAPDKILAFYRKDMARYGNLIECDSKTISFQSRKHDPDAPVRCESDGGMRKIKELKAGVESNQHVVAIESKGSGSEFSLVFVRLRDSKDTI
jgi:hypothetical protein